MIAESLRPPAVQFSARPASKQGEHIHCNDAYRRIEPILSVLVPVYHYDSSALAETLGRCGYAENVELIFYDDGSGDPALTSKLTMGVDQFPGAACLVTAEHNLGRSGGRNRLEELARSEWMLFLDADMLPDDTGFLKRYLKQIKEHRQPILVVGGFSLKQAVPSPENALHWKQCAVSECVPADIRQTNPGRFVFTSNVLVHKDIMAVVPFDSEFEGWGWEDVDWGLRAARRFPVIHIDNTATHVGLDPASTLVRKYSKSGRNFWLAADRHPDALKSTGLYRMAVILSYIPGRSLFKYLFKGLALLPGFLAPVGLRLTALKLYRAFVHAEARHAKG